MIEIKKMEQAVDVSGKKQDTVHLELHADDISEMSSFDKTSLDIPESITIQAGSFAYDNDGNVAILGSDGTWNTVQ